MKKIIILILYILVGISQGYSCLVDCNYTPANTEKKVSDGTNCRYHNSEFCTKNYLYGSKIYQDAIDKNTIKIFNVGKIWVSKYDFDFDYEKDLTYSFGGGYATKNINKIIYKISEKRNKVVENKYLIISKIYESKYGNHVIYSVLPYVNNTENDFTEKEIKEGKQELFKKYKDVVGLYIDDKRVGEYSIDGKYDYKNLDSFLLKNKIMAFDYDDNYVFPKTDYILKEKTIKILKNFIEKVEKIKYNKEKLLKKIDKIYNKYKNKNGRKNKFIREILLYLHTEILINKLKQDNNLLKINYNI